MSLKITEDMVTSDETAQYAIRREDGSGWVVTSRDPDRRFDRNQAITALILEEERNRRPPYADPEAYAAYVESLESELR